MYIINQSWKRAKAVIKKKYPTVWHVSDLIMYLTQVEGAGCEYLGSGQQ